jgi:hypothetical protein
MKSALFCTLAVFTLMLCTASANAQLLFSYEAGETGMPYVGNPALYVVSTSTTTGVTNGLQSLQVTVPIPTFGGPTNATRFTDATRANLINNNDLLAIDMTVPNIPFGFGNIDLQFFQTNIRPGFDADETRFSGTFATSSGQTVTLFIPLTTTQFGTPHIHLDPAQPWAYQIDLSFNSANSGPFTFQFDNLRVVPEPATLGCCGLLAGAALLRRRRA